MVLIRWAEDVPSKVGVAWVEDEVEPILAISLN